MTEEAQWLTEFCREDSEAAFQHLVDRHLTLVFSTAMRHMNGNAQQAEDICQAVFSNLAGKAKSLPADVVLAG